jgi:serine/threonine-protein phosphatase 2B catalytic subunit
MDCFDSMPIAGLVGEKYFAIHGGISPELNKIASIDTAIDRFQEVPTSGIFCDLVWADPVDEKDSNLMTEFSHNDDRDCSVFFGAKATKKIIEENSLISILRGH